MEVFDSEGKSIFDSAPKKKKRYVLYLFKLTRDDETRIRTVEKAIQNSLSEHIMVRFEDPNEALKALIVKNIELIFIDSSLFDDDKIAIDFGVECKKRKKCPLFFIAKNEDILITEYRKKLAFYEELDDYFKDPIDFMEITRKLKRASNTIGRKAKRFSLGIPIKLYRLNDDKYYDVILNDISLVGFSISIVGNEMLKTNEQVKIKVPINEFNLFHPTYGEFLPVSGKVRRISINGHIFGCSIEFSTPMQLEVLMNLLEKVTRKMRMVKIAEKPKKEVDPVPV
ncbi:PilZ domain-containing protein [Silvanigrella sp.]|jgi:hypothetical protein|uniref:PilZ domain-containing protein n=1 Tax=Silvanigrella sp. TaxID=2024976 RepID=UPI0037C70E40|nr:PilZ domain-containing protein [Silvanigrellaceae bacterium]